MNLLSGIIATSLIRCMENLPEWVLLTAVGCTILLVLILIWLVIRKLNSQDSPSPKQNTPAKPPMTPAPGPAVPSTPKMTPRPVSIPVSKPQPMAPVQSVPSPVAEPRHEEPLKEVSIPPVKPASQQPPVLDPAIYKKIAALSGVNKTVLFAGAGLEHLPVTIPVQTAVKLAGSGKKVLLIDLDMKRNAIAKVFDPSETTVKTCTRPKPLPSSVENLSFWPADFFARFGQINLRTLIQSASAHFDLLLINAPFLDGHPDRKLIASSAKYGLIFCKTKQQFERLQTLLTLGECQLLESKPIEC
jgi:Mrp family chromosome partitioning ATPase